MGADMSMRFGGYYGDGTSPPSKSKINADHRNEVVLEMLNTDPHYRELNDWFIDGNWETTDECINACPVPEDFKAIMALIGRFAKHKREVRTRIFVEQNCYRYIVYYVGYSDLIVPEVNFTKTPITTIYREPINAVVQVSGILHGIGYDIKNHNWSEESPGSYTSGTMLWLRYLRDKTPIGDVMKRKARVRLYIEENQWFKDEKEAREILLRKLSERL